MCQWGGIKSRWRSDRPRIMILLLVGTGEIITLQAQSEGTRTLALCLFLPLSPLSISNFHFQQLHCLFLSLPFSPPSLTHSPSHAAWLSYSTGHRFKLSPHPLTLCSDTAHQPWSPQRLRLASVDKCVRACVWCWMHVVYSQCRLVFICYGFPL